MISLATCPRNASPIIRAADPEEAIFYAGEACDEVIELKSGIVRAVRLSRDGHRQILSFFCAGDYLGSPATHIHAFTAEAVTPVRYHRYSKSRWTAQLRQDGCDDGNLFGPFSDSKNWQLIADWFLASKGCKFGFAPSSASLSVGSHSSLMERLWFRFRKSILRRILQPTRLVYVARYVVCVSGDF